MSRIRLSLLLSVWLLLLAHAAGAVPGADALFHRSHAERSLCFDRVVLPYLEKLPGPERWRQLAALQQRAAHEQDAAAALELAIGRYELLDMSAGISADEKINGMEQLLGKLDQARYPEYAAIIMHFLGQNYYGKKFNYTRAFEYFINAHQLASGLSQRDFPEKKQILTYIGNRYYAIGDYAKARQVLLEADSLVHPWDHFIVYNGKNTLGLIYRAAGDYRRAMRYFQQAHTLAAAAGDQTWMAITSGNTGICYYQQHDYDRAIPLLEADVRGNFSNAVKAADNGVNSLLILADIYLERNQVSQAGQAIQLAQHYIDSCRDKVKARGMLYPLWARYRYARGDYRRAYQYQDSAALYKDSLSMRDNLNKVTQVEYRKHMENADARLKRLHAEKKLLSFTRNTLFAGILLLVAITGLIISRQRLRYRLKQGSILARKRQTEQELRTATQQLADFTRHLQEKNLLIEQSSQEIERLRQSVAGQSQDTADVLAQLHNATILTDDEWNSFKVLFEQVHKGFLHRLREKMPELTPADTRFMVLSKLNLSNKEMAGILGVQPDTIRSYKHRLRRRFNLPEEENIKRIVDSI